MIISKSFRLLDFSEYELHAILDQGPSYEMLFMAINKKTNNLELNQQPFFCFTFDVNRKTNHSLQNIANYILKKINYEQFNHFFQFQINQLYL